MAAKLSPVERAEIADLTAKRNALTRMIAKLMYERRQLPKPGALAKKYQVSHRTVARAARREPYCV